MFIIWLSVSMAIFAFVAVLASFGFDFVSGLAFLSWTTSMEYVLAMLAVMPLFGLLGALIIGVFQE